ncbi:MAG: hypothetical protein ACRDYY_00825, partial [Acidimicrobiales bacterium]
TMVASLVAGAVGLVALLFLGLPWAAVGFCAGLGMGMGNFRLIVRSVVRVGKRHSERTRRPLAINTLGRLAVMTVVALVLVWFVPPLGLGIVGGIAVFQVVLLANVTRSMLKSGGAGGGGLLLAALSGSPMDEIETGDTGGDVASGGGRGAA